MLNQLIGRHRNFEYSSDMKVQRSIQIQIQHSDLVFEQELKERKPAMSLLLLGLSYDLSCPFALVGQSVGW